MAKQAGSSIVGGRYPATDDSGPDVKVPGTVKPMVDDSNNHHTAYGFSRVEGTAASATQADVWPSKRMTPVGRGNEDLSVSGMRRPIELRGGLAAAAASLRDSPMSGDRPVIGKSASPLRPPLHVGKSSIPAPMRRSVVPHRHEHQQRPSLAAVVVVAAQ
ncbi:MAG TPA: hypothetical protein VN802_01895 [Stellaceae bacterium]|nr:hypothetical protein [Stellaceae bacterium]